jgi:uncharacterized membrane protein YcgQ (UPF0703/DUF1980 family)
MAHAHEGEHDHYTLDQLCTIALCGALGLVMVLLWKYDVLRLFLVPAFHIRVLVAGIALLTLVVIRVIALAVSMRQSRSAAVNHVHNHDHEHDHDCGHDHDHHHHHHHHEHSHAHGVTEPHSHDDLGEHTHAHENGNHDHGHDHGFAPWRYVVLLLPILFFLLKIPWPEKEEKEKDDPNVTSMKLAEAEQAGLNPDAYKDKTVRIKGILWPSNNSKVLGLARMKMSCCAADAFPDPANLEVHFPDELNPAGLATKWVKVYGTLKYVNRPDKPGPYTVVEATKIERVKTPGDPFNP